jgi:hypothetical protein
MFPLPPPLSSSQMVSVATKSAAVARYLFPRACVRAMTLTAAEAQALDAR